MTSAVVICPGRGTYNASELGYLARHFPDRELLAEFDSQRSAAGQETLSALDGAERFSLANHTRGDNASGLIYASSYGDFRSINREEIDIVAVTGNSMGWYTALACGGALTAQDGFRVANTMGTLMQEALIGGQLVYPWMDENWRADGARKTELLELVSEINARAEAELYFSIDLGGMLILAGNSAGLEAFEQAVEPVQQRFPMRLGNHAAFHTSLQSPVAEKGRSQLDKSLFNQPILPMIDGEGNIWWPGSTRTDSLYDYTLGAQVTETYDFTKAITVAAREFTPDLFIVLGPGNTLGGAVVQSLICAQWRGMADKATFQALQQESPVIAAMGMPEQRQLCT